MHNSGGTNSGRPGNLNEHTRHIASLRDTMFNVAKPQITGGIFEIGKRLKAIHLETKKNEQNMIRTDVQPEWKLAQKNNSHLFGKQANEIDFRTPLSNGNVGDYTDSIPGSFPVARNKWKSSQPRNK